MPCGRAIGSSPIICDKQALQYRQTQCSRRKPTRFSGGRMSHTLLNWKIELKELEMNYSALPEFSGYLKKEGIASLYPHQVDGINVLSRGESLLLATPTSSGKTAVAYYGIIRAWRMGLRSLYIVPLRALAEEKREDMRFFEEMGMSVGISTGDFDNPSNQLKNYDVVISTSEKVDSLLRNNLSVSTIWGL